MERARVMIDHVYISVNNIQKSLAFYLAALEPLGWREFGKYDAASGPDTVPDLYGIGALTYVSGTGVGSSTCLRLRKRGETRLHLGILCDPNHPAHAHHTKPRAGSRRARSLAALTVSRSGARRGTRSLWTSGSPALIAPSTGKRKPATTLSSCSTCMPWITRSREARWTSTTADAAVVVWRRRM